MSVEATAPGESVIGRAAGIDDVIATMGTLAPGNDLSRGLRLLQPFPGDPDRLDAAAQGYQRAAEDVERSVDDLARQFAGLFGQWQGAAADGASQATRDGLDRARRDSAGARGIGTAVRALADALRPEVRQHEDIVRRVGAMQAVTVSTGPLAGPVGARDAAVDALREGAALLRRVHEHDQDAARRIRAVLGDVADPVGAPSTAPADGGRIVGLDAPARGQSGVQQAGPVLVVTLNGADTQKLIDTAGIAGPVLGVGGVLASIFSGGAAAPVLVLGGEAALLGKLTDLNRTPEGIRIYFVGSQFVSVNGR